MARYKFEFEMPATESVVFDAFHYTAWRNQWDTLVGKTQVMDEAPCPFLGAVTKNTGKGILRPLSMQTKFITFNRPQIAAATMIGKSFPFSHWAASMQHKALPDGNSMLIYIYSFEVWPKKLAWLLQPAVALIFNRQTRRRFARLKTYLQTHAEQIEQWQKPSKARQHGELQ